MGGKGAKVKGYRYEKEIEKDGENHGIKIVRTWCSDGRSSGYTKEVDLIAETGKTKTLIQAKRRRRLSKTYIPSCGIDAVVMREDHGESVLCCRFNDWLTDQKRIIDLEIELKKYKGE